MKRIICLPLIVFCVLVLVACANATPEHVEEMIRSGDEIDGMLFSPLDDALNWSGRNYKIPAFLGMWR